jgi:hypothetical protein
MLFIKAIDGRSRRLSPTSPSGCQQPTVHQAAAGSGSWVGSGRRAVRIRRCRRVTISGLQEPQPVPAREAPQAKWRWSRLRGEEFKSLEG